jgi:hypothetical protein
MGSSIAHVTILMIKTMLTKTGEVTSIIPRMANAGIKINPKSTAQYH